MKCNVIVIALVALAAFGCKKSEEQTEAAVDTEVTGPNQLTNAQESEGWKLLFDGQSMSGWRTYQGVENNRWEVVDGTLHCKPLLDTAVQNADLMTEAQYDNFELAFEWKISPGGNSGVMFRVTEDQDRPYYTGPEYQLIDDLGWPDSLSDSQLSGANYDMHPRTNDTVKPTGEWNSSRLLVNGNHVEHWLNGSKVVEYELGSDDWKKRKDASKWKDVANYGIRPTGHIDFQDHDHEAWFRNIMIREL